MNASRFKTARKERSGWRDASLSERHRHWGFDCPAVDLDFLLLEFHHGTPKAIVEYKGARAERVEGSRYGAGRIEFRHPKWEAVGRLASCYCHGELPFLFAFYWEQPYRFLVVPVNDAAARRFDAPWELCSEHEYVAALYELRGTLKGGFGSGHDPRGPSVDLGREPPSSAEVDELVRWQGWRRYQED